jgi:hypothetical protein
MFVLIATLCSGVEANTCVPMIWAKESYATFEACENAKEEALSALPPGVVYAFSRCVMVPELPGESA